jgi:mevalonate kinase
MSTTTVSAPGKVILFGEHAVVYGYPAIAVPVTQVSATAIISDGKNAGIFFDLPNLKKSYSLTDSPSKDPFGMAVRLVMKNAGIKTLPNLNITINSTIPIASGLGSGAATATALIRALVQHLDIKKLNKNDQISNLVFHIECIHHGTPSGIDNTVIAYEKPVFFVKTTPKNKIEKFSVGAPLHLLIADTGIASPTKETVADVRHQWLANPDRFDNLFLRCGNIAETAQIALKSGSLNTVGDLMNQNHILLHSMTVSSPELERLVAFAIMGGTLGAKMSGGGRGGNMIALVSPEKEATVRNMLLQGGAKSVLSTVVNS